MYANCFCFPCLSLLTSASYLSFLFLFSSFFCTFFSFLPLPNLSSSFPFSSSFLILFSHCCLFFSPLPSLPFLFSLFIPSFSFHSFIPFLPLLFLVSHCYFLLFPPLTYLHLFLLFSLFSSSFLPIYFHSSFNLTFLLLFPTLFPLPLLPSFLFLSRVSIVSSRFFLPRLSFSQFTHLLFLLSSHAPSLERFNAVLIMVSFFSSLILLH